MKVSTKPAPRRGAMMVMVAITMVILFVAAAFAIDIAWMHATRAELRTATDAAARAASESLGRLQDSEAAIAAAEALARANTVAGEPLELDRTDVVFGSHSIQSDGRFRFEPGGTPPNSVRVIGRRTADSPSGPVPLFFGPLFGVTEFQPRQQATASRLDRDIALVLDVSGSMAEFGRFPALTNALSVFLSELENLPQEEFVSLTVYNHEPRRVQEMTSDLGLIEEAFSEESPGGFTAIGLALETGLDSIVNDPASRPFAFRELILMTDGNHNTGISPLDIVPDAVAERVIVHTITFSDGANQDLMRQVAEAAGGSHLHADTNQQLVDVFREIALQIPVVLID
jgi:Mg-chelatase subunit ChlD